MLQPHAWDMALGHYKPLVGKTQLLYRLGLCHCERASLAGTRLLERRLLEVYMTPTV